MPTTWKRCLLCDIGDIVSGGTPSTKDLSNFGGNIGWITPADMTGYTNKYIKEGKRNLTEKGLKKSAAVLLPKGTVLFSSRAPIGYIAITASPLATNQGFKNFIPNSKLISSDFIYYLLWNSRNLIKSMASGTTFLEISAKRFAQVPVTLPPMAEQKRIVKKIEELFGVIDEQVKRLEATHAALVSYRQSILQQAFSGKLYKTTNWDNYFFSDLCTYIQRGKSPKYTEQSSLPVINQKCIRWNELQTQYLKFIDPIQFQSWTKERHVKPMDILWNSTGTGTIGRAYLYKGTELSDAVVDSHVTILRANPVKVLPHFLFLYIQSPFVQQKIEKMQSGSTNQVELARKEIQNISISLPSLPEQKAIVKKIENAFAFADKAQAAIIGALEQAKQLKQSILKRAFEGKLVPQDPKDKPVDLTQLKKDKQK